MPYRKSKCGIRIMIIYTYNSHIKPITNFIIKHRICFVKRANFHSIDAFINNLLWFLSISYAACNSSCILHRKINTYFLKWGVYFIIVKEKSRITVKNKIISFNSRHTSFNSWKSSFSESEIHPQSPSCVCLSICSW